MKSFYSLEIEKQDKIINSAMYIFAKNGYKKAYMSEIANRAEITKPTLFYYFKTKLNLYEYLVDVCSQYIEGMVEVESVGNIDFFEGIVKLSTKKFAALQLRPSITRFMTSLYFEQDPEVQAVKNKYIEHASELQSHLVNNNLDTSKFKPDIDSDIVMNLMEKWSTGYITQLEKQADLLTDDQLTEYYKQMQIDFMQLVKLLETNFYM